MRQLFDEQGKTSPVLIIALVLTLAAGAYFTFAPSGTPAPAALASPPKQPGVPAPGVSAPGVPAPGVPAPGMAPSPSVSPSPKAPPEAADVSTTRDPFTPGKVAILGLKNNNPESSPLYVRPSPGSNSIPSLQSPDDKPAYKGSAKTETGQVAIVTYKKKSYLLQIGDRLPGTDYRLAQIQPDAIVFDTGSEQIRLTKKGEAK
jgi:hypothetical protein